LESKRRGPLRYFYRWAGAFEATELVGLKPDVIVGASTPMVGALGIEMPPTLFARADEVIE
jgi:hypothetical protein